MVTYEAMTHQCGRSVVQVLAVRVEKEMVTYEAMTYPVWEVSGSDPGCQSGHRSGDLLSCDTLVWEVSGSRPGCQSGYKSGDL